MLPAGGPSATGRSGVGRGRALLLGALAYAAIALGAMLAGGASAPWPGAVLLVLVVSASGAALTGRELALVTAAAALALLGSAAGEASGVLAVAGATELLPGDVADAGSTLSGLGAALIAGAALPLVALVTHVAARRGRLARVAARRAERRRAELEVERDEVATALELERESRSAGPLAREALQQALALEALEERNRYLSIVNAVSFALSDPLDDPLDEPAAIERACRFLARLLGREAAQLYLTPPADGPVSGNAIRIFASLGTAPWAPLPEEELAAVALQAGGGGLGAPTTAGVDSRHDGRRYVIVPVSAKGRPLGALALLGEGHATASDQEQQLLLLIGRELGAAIEGARLYRDAVEKADRDELFAEVLRALASEPVQGRALETALEVAARALDTRVLAVLHGGGRGTLPQILASRGDVGAPGVRAALLGMLAQATDRWQPLQRGEGGEMPLSPALRAAGIGALLVAPLTMRQAAQDAGERGAGESQQARTSVSLPAGALVAAAGPGARWGAAERAYLQRVAEALARRLESDALIELQARRIVELSALTEVARVMQHTADPERLCAGAHTLAGIARFRYLYFARVDEMGRPEPVACFSGEGQRLPPRRAATLDAQHPWFALREAEDWSRESDGDAPAFLDAGDAHALVVPLRPKGQSLGVAVLGFEERPPGEERQLAVHAAEQLALALDSAHLYRQATERAARIQVQSNLARIVASVADLRAAFDAFAEEVRWLIPFDRALMLLVDEEAGTVSVHARYPDDAALPSEVRPLAETPAAIALAADGPVALRPDDPRLEGLDWSLVGGAPREVALVPVRGGGRTAGIFALAQESDRSYAADELAALHEVSGLLAVTIERLQLFEAAEHNARHDALTGLPNYRYLQERISELDGALAAGAPAAVVMIDMDELKLFNDLLGHEAGDQVVQVVAHELRAVCRTEDFVARAGGDEFVVLMEGVGSEDAVAGRLHGALAEAHRRAPNAPGPARISIGIAVAPDDGATAAELLQAADQAMYDAKAAGGRRTRLARERRDAGPAARGRPNRVVELLVRAALAGASEAERHAVATAQRYALGAGLALHAPQETAIPVQMMVAGRAAARLDSPSHTVDQRTTLMLLDGLADSSASRFPAASFAAPRLAELAVELAWLQLAEGRGSGLSLEEALASLDARVSGDGERRIVEALTRAARDEPLPVPSEAA